MKIKSQSIKFHGKCLDYNGKTDYPHLWDCHMNKTRDGSFPIKNQNWQKKEIDEDGVFELKLHGKCLKREDDGNVIMTKCDKDDAGQKWSEKYGVIYNKDGHKLRTQGIEMYGNGTRFTTKPDPIEMLDAKVEHRTTILKDKLLELRSIPFPNKDTTHVVKGISSSTCAEYCRGDDPGHKYSYFDSQENKCYCMFGNDDETTLVNLRTDELYQRSLKK